MYKLITQFCNFIFGKHKSNTLPRRWILAVDMMIVILAYVLAIFMLYFEDIKESLFDWSRIWLVPIVYLIAFLISRTFPIRGWRTCSIRCIYPLRTGSGAVPLRSRDR